MGKLSNVQAALYQCTPHRSRKRWKRWKNRKKKKNKTKKEFAESGTRTPTLPFTGIKARIVPVEPPRLDNELKGFIARFILPPTCVSLPPFAHIKIIATASLNNYVSKKSALSDAIISNTHQKSSTFPLNRFSLLLLTSPPPKKEKKPLIPSPS